ncbi:MAG: dienelactone hydrolase family protein [Rhodospirillaceae bacterium]|nr:dienelactone hydrolase family protein [Rhodospirillaceae bacterium]
MNPAMLWTGPENALPTVLLAHGAGAPMDTPFMTFFAEGIAGLGYRVGRFEFPYMAERRKSGARKPPNPTPILLQTWRAAIAACKGPVVIGGKSMGGRIASMIADDAKVAALICLGYPFYGAGKRDKPRTAHLETLKTPTLICQGERDPLGDRAAVEALTLSPAITMHWLPDGDHDLKPRKASGRTHDQNLHSALDGISTFLSALR